MPKELAKQYAPQGTEDRIYQCQKLPSLASYSTSASEMEVLQWGHQLTMRLPR